jgi:LysR family glycine cleavage system transcriptional activator
MTKLPPLAAIRVFEAAARHGNYTRAAEELGLTQAGVSYQMRVLEERLGTVLFTRQGRGMVLTPAGKAIAPQITKAFADLAASFDLLKGEDDAILSISSSQTFATQILAPRLGSFQIAHPEIAVRIDVSDRLVDLESGECDVAIRATKHPPEKLHWHFLMKIGISAMVSPEFLKSNPIKEAKAIPRSLRVSSNYFWWESWDKSHGRIEGTIDQEKSAAGLQFDSQILDANAAMAGNAIALLMPPFFRNELASGRLIQPFDHIAWLETSFRLVYPEVRKNARKVRLFRAWLEKEMDKILGEDPYGFRIEA